MTELTLRGDNGSTVTSIFLLCNAVAVVGVLKHRPGRTTSTFIKYLYTLYSLHCSVQLSRCLVRTQSLPYWAHCTNSLLTGNDIQGTSANYCEHLSTLSIRAYNSNTQHFAVGLSDGHTIIITIDSE